MWNGVAFVGAHGMKWVGYACGSVDGGLSFSLKKNVAMSTCTVPIGWCEPFGVPGD